MNTKDLLIQEIEQVPEPILDEVLDFLRFLKTKHEQKKLESQADKEDARAALEEAKEEDTTLLPRNVMPAPFKSPVIRWINGNLQIRDIILPWQQCTVHLNEAYKFEDEDYPNSPYVEDCVMFKFSHPNLVPEFFPNIDNPEKWVWVLNGELAEAIRQFLASSSS